MPDDLIIIRLFSTVMASDINDHRVNTTDIRTAIQNMKEVYKPNPASLKCQTAQTANYNDVAHRCAYLHKYAPFHTAMVADMLQRAILQNNAIFRYLQNSSGVTRLCCLGGGPGNDVIGVLSILSVGLQRSAVVSATIIDIMPEWNVTFASLVNELRYGNYGKLGDCVNKNRFNWSYIGCNLLGTMTNEVSKSISSADLLTMVKFVSAAACKDTSSMISNIFRKMKSGAMVLFIDNAGGGFHQMMCRVATECGLETVFGPLRHEHYLNQSFNVKNFGYTPCFETKVSVHMWKKPGRNIGTAYSSPIDNMGVLKAQLLQTKIKNSKDSPSTGISNEPRWNMSNRNIEGAHPFQSQLLKKPQDLYMPPASLTSEGIVGQQQGSRSFTPMRNSQGYISSAQSSPNQKITQPGQNQKVIQPRQNQKILNDYINSKQLRYTSGTMRDSITSTHESWNSSSSAFPFLQQEEGDWFGYPVRSGWREVSGPVNQPQRQTPVTSPAVPTRRVAATSSENRFLKLCCCVIS